MNKVLLKLVITAGSAAYFPACMPLHSRDRIPVVPAEDFAEAARNGNARDYSFLKRSLRPAQNAAEREPAKAGLTRASFNGDPRYLDKGFELKGSANVPSQRFTSDGGAAPETSMMSSGQPPYPPQAALPAPPPGSSAPYYKGQMNSNPSLWPDEAQGAFLFTDHRAFRAMDVITITINENSKGKKKAETDLEQKYDLLAGITNFFGVETKQWAAHNTALSPSALINASTENKFEGNGETKREGSLQSSISAVVMEILPNGLMRLEGTKILSMDAEEEVLVISGLVRPRDVDANNQISSSRIANMRIDFYGRGVLGDQTSPGWGAKLFEVIWPF